MYVEDASAQLKKQRFQNVFCDGEIYDTGDNKDIFVYGRIKEVIPSGYIYYVAANPPDYRATFTGSGLPFANQSQAFENTPNKGRVSIINNSFEIQLMYPNSYYVGLGTVIVPPTVYIEYVNSEGKQRNMSIKLSDGIPYRMLSYPMQNTLPRKDAMFYKYGWLMPVRTQEQILRDSAYPDENKMASNFWGLKPPL
jgi:hypothetical protein